MESTLAEKKKKITDWVNNLEDNQLVEKLNDLMKHEKKIAFEKEFEKGITGDELRKNLHEYIESLPWKVK